VPEKIAQGDWKYKLYVNEVEAGTALISNKIKDNKYISSSEYSMKLADLNTLTRDVITETTDFKPVKLESYSKIVNKGQVTETNIISIFKGKEVEVTYGKKKVNYTVNRDFIIDGNFFMTKLIEAKFKQGFEITNYVYNPSVELETPIKVTTKVVGFEKIMINGKENKLMHIVQSLENIKDNIDLFIDEHGVLQKGIIYMLNLKIELIKI
jgi:hypothetical protein